MFAPERHLLITMRNCALQLYAQAKQARFGELLHFEKHINICINLKF